MKKKIKLLAILFFTAIFTIQAQQGFQRRTVQERVKQTLDILSDSLKLRKVQQADVDTVLSEYYKGQDKLRDGLTPGTRPDMAEIEKLITIRDAKLKIILTEPQYNKYKEMEAAMQKRGKGQRPPGR